MGKIKGPLIAKTKHINHVSDSDELSKEILFLS